MLVEWDCLFNSNVVQLVESGGWQKEREQKGSGRELRE